MKPDQGISERIGVVYAFVDDDGTVRYVGKTVESDWWERIRFHLRSAFRPQHPFEVWLRARLEQEGIPKVVLLERVPESALIEREQRWIAKYTSPQLLNVVGVQPARQEPVVIWDKSHCLIPASSPTDAWVEIAGHSVDPGWRHLAKVLGPTGKAVSNRLRLVETTHSALATLVRAGRSEDADRLLVASILHDWNRAASSKLKCRQQNSGHLALESVDGIARALAAAEFMSAYRPAYRHSEPARTMAPPLGEMLRLSGHTNMTPDDLAVAIRRASKNYALEIIGDLYDVSVGGDTKLLDAPDYVASDGAQAPS